jgi:hypothetical protein
MSKRMMLHITAGHDNWTPTAEELEDLMHVFQMATVDPNGSVVVTSNMVKLDADAKKSVHAKIIWLDADPSDISITAEAGHVEETTTMNVSLDRK